MKQTPCRHPERKDPAEIRDVLPRDSSTPLRSAQNDELDPPAFLEQLMN